MKIVNHTRQDSDEIILIRTHEKLIHKIKPQYLHRIRGSNY